MTLPPLPPGITDDDITASVARIRALKTADDLASLTRVPTPRPRDVRGTVHALIAVVVLIIGAGGVLATLGHPWVGVAITATTTVVEWANLLIGYRRRTRP